MDFRLNKKEKSWPDEQGLNVEKCVDIIRGNQVLSATFCYSLN